MAGAIPAWLFDDFGWFCPGLFNDLRDCVVEVIGNRPVSNLDGLALQFAVFENDETGNHLRPVTKLVEFVAVGFTTEDRATVVAHGHLGDVSALVVFIFFFAYKPASDGIGGVFNSISFDSVGGDLDQLGWTFDRAPVFKLDPGGFSFDSTHGTEQAILFFGAIEDCYRGSWRDAVLSCAWVGTTIVKTAVA